MVSQRLQLQREHHFYVAIAKFLFLMRPKLPYESLSNFKVQAVLISQTVHPASPKIPKMRTQGAAIGCVGIFVGIVKNFKKYLL